MAVEVIPKRIALVISAATGEELKAGNSDVSNVYACLTRPELGGCSNEVPPVHRCKSRNDFFSCLSAALRNWCLTDQFVFYFSGHGEIRNDEYCLKFGTEDYMPFRALTSELQATGVKRAILILDACYSGAALERTKDGSDVAERIIKQPISKGIAIISSSLKSQTSHELKDGSLSVFTKLFCQGIDSGLDGESTNNGYISIENIITYINNKLRSDKEYQEFHQKSVYSTEKTDGEIWISKNKSGSSLRSIQPQSSTFITSSEELRVLYETTILSQHPCIGATADDLDWGLIKLFSKKIGLELDLSLDKETVLSKLKLYSPIKHGGQSCIHKAAILCFHPRPETLYSQARSIFVVGNASDKEFIREDVYGSLSTQVKLLIEKVKNHIEVISYVDENGIRREIQEVDIDVVRELISNAISHRDYASSGIVKVSITPEIIEVQSPGAFPLETSWDKLIDCSIEASLPIDAAISHYLTNLLVFEGIGRGFSTFRKYRDKHDPDSISCTELNDPGPIVCICVRRNTEFRQHTVAKELVLVGVAPEFELGRYAEGLREQYGNLKLESLDTTGAYYNELKLWKVFVPQNVRGCQEFLPQIHEIPKEHLRRLRDRGELSEAVVAESELEQHRRVYGEQTIRSVLEVVSNPVGETLPSAVQYAVILGDPGAGKSSLLQYLALGWAEQPLSQLPLHPIPLLIELRTYARDKQERKCPDLLSFIHGGNLTCRLNQQQLHDKLRAGQAVALFDGMDEVFDPQLRDEVVTDIHRFTSDYPQVRVVVTSRWLGYKAQRLRDAGFLHFMLQDLEEEQIQDFVQRWHNLTFTDGVDRARKQERLEKAIRDSKAIRELAGNPLLLTMMAILNRNQELLRDRPEFYNQASRVLLHQWDVERALVQDGRLDPKTIDYRDKQVMLRKVAHHMQSSQKGLAGNIISAADLERILTDYLKTIEVEQPRTVARLLIDQLRTRNFILCYLGADSYAFVHRTFLEYFCAWEFVWQFKETQTLSIEQLTEEVFGHWREESWEEVMCLISGMINASFTGKIIAWLLEQPGENDKFANLFLAAKCLVEVRNRAEIVPIAHQLSEQIRALAAYGLSDDYGDAGGLEKKISVVVIRLQAISAIAATWQEEPSTLFWLKTLAQSDEDTNVRITVVEELARRWKNDPETLPWLKTLAQSDEDTNVRMTVVQELARRWKDDPETLPWLKTLAQSDEHWAVRMTVVQELARGWKDDPETLSWLKTLAQSDENNIERMTVVEELARGWKDDPETLPILKTLAQSDKNYDVRRTAVQELAQGWKEEPKMFEFLFERALHDPFERELEVQNNPRQTALEAVVENYPTDSRIRDLLHRALNDPDEKVREYAKRQLAKLG